MFNRLPTRFRHYEVLKLLGNGSFAVVYLARDTHLRRFVALKMLHPDLAAQSDMVRRFLREARAMAGLDHVNIVRVNRVENDPQQPFFEMEYVEGDTLAEYRGGRVLSLQEAIPILKQMAAALDAAHQKGIVHRDIKPTNVLIKSDGQVKLTDFGIIKHLQPTRSGPLLTHGVAGTPNYIAPEQADENRKHEIGPASDIYALGVVSYKLLTGRLPFERSDYRAVIAAHISQAPPDPRTFNRHLPASVAGVLLKALAKQPSDRYPSAMAFVEALEQAAWRPTALLAWLTATTRQLFTMLSALFLPILMALAMVMVIALGCGLAGVCFAESESGVAPGQPTQEASAAAAATKAPPPEPSPATPEPSPATFEPSPAPSEPPTATSESPTATPEPPTAPSEPPTGTSEPSPVTSEPPPTTSEPPTATSEPPTATSEPPTATSARPTVTSEPPTATSGSPTATPEPSPATSEPSSVTPEPSPATSEPSGPSGPSAIPEPPTESPEPPSATSEPSPAPPATSEPPTGSPEPPSASPEPPSASPEPPSASPKPPSARPELPTATSSPAQKPAPSPPAATSQPPTVTSIPSNAPAEPRMVGRDGMILLYVREGKFIMGSKKEDDPDAFDDEQPQREVYLDPFWIDQTEVTNQMYAACVAAGKCTPPSSNRSLNRESYYDNQEYSNYPVINVSSYDAHTYCEWAGRRLPTEAEWEKAARGTDGRIYPWGNQAPTQYLLNFNLNRDTTAVGSYPDGASPYGALDMAGNVWEWVADWYDKQYYRNSPDTNPSGPSERELKPRRGGSWYTDQPRGVRAASRYPDNPAESFVTGGLRCARSP